MNAHHIAMTVVALDPRGDPIGTAALTEHDMETHRDLGLYTNGAEGLYQRLGWKRS